MDGKSVKPNSCVHIHMYHGKDNALIPPDLMSEVEELKRSFYKALLDPDYREAFNLLVRAWCSEDTAMSLVLIPCVLDNMNLMANVHNKKCIEELGKRINDEILELERRMDELEKVVYEIFRNHESV